MKKGLQRIETAVSAVSLLLVLFLSLFSLGGCRDAAYSEGLAFRSLGDGTCLLAGIGSCKDAHLEVPPKSPLGDRVVGVAEYAFSGNAELLSVHLPKGLATIGAFAFSGCRALEDVTFEEGLTQIGINAFESCASLARVVTQGKTKELKVPVTGAGGEVLYTLEYPMVVFPDSLTQIGDCAFLGCAALPGLLYLEDSLSTVGSCAFLECGKLQHVYIEGDDLSLGVDVFRGNERLTLGLAAKNPPAGFESGWDRMHATASYDPHFGVSLQEYVSWFVNRDLNQ